MYKKLEYFHAYTKRTPEEVKRGTLTPLPKAGRSGRGGNRSTGGHSGTGGNDWNNHGTHGNTHGHGGTKGDGLDWDKFGPNLFAAEYETQYLSSGDAVKLGEDSKPLLEFTKQAKDKIKELEDMCDKVTKVNE